MARSRRNRTSRKRENSRFGLRFFLFFLIFVLIGCGYGAYRFPSTRQFVNRCVSFVLGKTRGGESPQHKGNGSRPEVPSEPTVASHTTIPAEPNITVPSSTTVQQEPVITVQTRFDHLKLGVPGKADTIIDRPGYALGYIEYHEQPAWVIYRLTKEQALTKAAKRGNDFREDPEIPTGSATLADYRRSGYDRGHLAPAADMAYSMRTMGDSFFMSNMSPQRPNFNRGVWKDLEAQVRSFAITEADVYIVTGPILPKTKTVTIGSNKVTVPTHYYKVVYDRTPPEKMIGFILPNDGSNRPLQDFAVTVDAVEAATGLNFFSTVPQPKQEQLESTITVRDWKWNK